MHNTKYSLDGIALTMGIYRQISKEGGVEMVYEKPAMIAYDEATIREIEVYASSCKCPTGKSTHA